MVESATHKTGGPSRAWVSKSIFKGFSKIGVLSSLKSPVCTMFPISVLIIRNDASGTEWIAGKKLFEAKKSQLFASELLKIGIYVVGFFYPVVPKDLARIRVQLSASHKISDIDFALEAFKKVGKDLGVF